MGRGQRHQQRQLDSKSVLFQASSLNNTVKEESEAEAEIQKLLQEKAELKAAERGGNFKCWRNEDGVIHRDGDRPAVICEDGAKEYWENGKEQKRGIFKRGKR